MLGREKSLFFPSIVCIPDHSNLESGKNVCIPSFDWFTHPFIHPANL